MNTKGEFRNLKSIFDFRSMGNFKFFDILKQWPGTLNQVVLLSFLNVCLNRCQEIVLCVVICTITTTGTTYQHSQHEELKNFMQSTEATML